MKRKYNAIYCLLLFLTIIITGCDVIKYYQRDYFYRDGCEWDHCRFPLIKPYFAIQIDNVPGWIVTLEKESDDKSLYSYYDVQNIEKIAVEKGIIMIYTPTHPARIDKNLEYESEIYNWFVLIPDKKIEKGFKSEKELLEYVQNFEVDDPDWLAPDDLSVQFEETRCLDWIPGC